LAQLRVFSPWETGGQAIAAVQKKVIQLFDFTR
jgi:hypothetical protein